MSEKKFYSDEKNVQVLVALLKAHGIKRAILSPGSANSPLVASLQHDSYFECYSCVDERSAAYMACGLAEETNEPVVISCTGATASRNYFPGVTEAFYRKLPVLAITSTQPVYRIGQHVAQVVDRSNQPNDAYGLSVTLPIVKDDADFNECQLKINTAIAQLRKGGGGSSHINLQTNSLRTYTTTTLPSVRKIDLVTSEESLPKIGAGRVAVILGSRRDSNKAPDSLIDRFCELNNAVVFCDHTSNYNGAYSVNSRLIGAQHLLNTAPYKPDLTIHVGEVSGDYYSIKLVGKEVWRVSPDGEIRDTYNRLSKLFQMPESAFFESYKDGESRGCEYYKSLAVLSQRLFDSTPEVPFSNIYVASVLSGKLPKKATIHFGILNSLRSWNFFELDASISAVSNVGGFGIDGCISSLIGSSFADRKKLFFGVFGDLAFFYDLNSLGNRHIDSNLRILLINNGLGTEFKTYNHHTSHFGDAADQFISAAGHFGQQSPDLVRNYAQNLGFEYFAASNKEEFLARYERFVHPEITDTPILFEVFTNSEDESKALELMMNIATDTNAKLRDNAKSAAKSILGDKGIQALRKIRGR